MAQLNIKTGTVTRKPLELPTPDQWELVHRTISRKIKEIRARYGHRITLKLLLPAFLQGHYLLWLKGRHFAHFYHATGDELQQIEGVPITWEAPTLHAYLYDVLVIPGYDGMDLTYQLPIWEPQAPEVGSLVISAHDMQALIVDVMASTGNTIMAHPTGAGLAEALASIKQELVAKYVPA